MLLSGSADPITPPRYADLAAALLRNSRHLVGERQGHGQIAAGCMPKIVAEFLSTTDLGTLDVSCMDKAFIMPFFLDFSGPAP